MKYVAAQYHRKQFALPIRPDLGLATLLNSRAECGFGRTSRRLLQLRGLRTFFVSLACISEAHVVKGYLLSRPVACLVVAKGIGYSYCRQDRKIGSLYMAAYQPS